MLSLLDKLVFIASLAALFAVFITIGAMEKEISI
jgi:hypothetical protein